MTTHALTVAAEVRDLRAADHLLHTLAAELDLPEGTFGCTHLIRGDRPRVALSLAVPSRPLLSTVQERLAARAHEVAPGTPDAMGRAVIYPGVTALTGTLTIADVLDRSAITRVNVLGSPARPAPDTPLMTQDHVRPHWHDGELVLTTMPAVGGTLVPFEVPEPTPCCADH
ncbi:MULTISPECIES: hypothetical protein [unclassified Streptomyces]|uniref:hypothetical protein n=1 Tax=unclassified Streptomyces TaxID=2593676 RepID=UPI002E767F5D|nr:MULTISPECIES: hypothetical protein [unclassified Streptomyces]MEE1764244.1 hypothetical protein [Streptomyces sp. SP18BB07]MEE1830890.1 hypothetical protein [Streptomyces sp. SP17KL33]